VQKDSIVYGICRMILKANENISRWFNRFAYFDFGRADMKTEFNKLISDYKTLKGNNLRTKI
jgi:hypothetical protein